MDPGNVSLFGKGVFADEIQLRILKGVHPGLRVWALNPMASVLVKDTQRQRWEGCSLNQGPMEPLQAGKARKDPPLEALGDLCLARPLTSDFRPLELQENTHLLL